MQFDIKILYINKDISIYKQWESFLTSSNIKAEKNVTYTIGIFENENLIATGSLYKNIIKCVAIKNSFQGGKVFNILISNLMSEAYDNGYNSLFVYTKENMSISFLNLDFKEIARVPNHLVFLEKSLHGFNEYLECLSSKKIYGNNISSIVMNVNPFTNGHLYLIERASIESDYVHVFIVSEEMSVFPSDVRIDLAKKATEHLKNIIFHKTGDYIISNKTFPSYFLSENSDVTYIHASLDAIIFKNFIAKQLHITKRYVGEEPLSISTNIYNKALKDIFSNEIELIVIRRKEYENDVISASKVRKLFLENNLDKIKNMVPKTTYNFLISDKGKLIQEKLTSLYKNGDLN